MVHCASSHGQLEPPGFGKLKGPWRKLEPGAGARSGETGELEIFPGSRGDSHGCTKAKKENSWVCMIVDREIAWVMMLTVDVFVVGG